MNDLKHKLYNACRQYVSKRLEANERAIALLQQDANEETKSSVGDKYETSRAMMQLEIEKHAAQLTALHKLNYVLDKIDPDNVNSVAASGSVVVTPQGNFYMSISAGQLLIDGTVYMAVSPGSPIGNKLLGLKEGERFVFNNQEFVIKAIY